MENGIFVMADDTHLSRWVEQDGRLDHAHVYLEKFKHLVPLGGTVIDCGTSIGDHTVTYASWVGPDGCVIGFEANPDVAECCALNLGIYPWARVLNCGLGETYGVCGISINANVGMSHLVPEGRNVKIEPLDAYVEQVVRCDFIKVDIEGCEVKFLKGATRFLDKHGPAILMEINRGMLAKQDATPKQIFDLLEKYGYIWEVADGEHMSEQYDILAIKKKIP